MGVTHLSPTGSSVCTTTPARRSPAAPPRPAPPRGAPPPRLAVLRLLLRDRLALGRRLFRGLVRLLGVGDGDGRGRSCGLLLAVLPAAGAAACLLLRRSRLAAVAVLGGGGGAELAIRHVDDGRGELGVLPGRDLLGRPVDVRGRAVAVLGRGRRFGAVRRGRCRLLLAVAADAARAARLLLRRSGGRASLRGPLGLVLGFGVGVGQCGLSLVALFLLRRGRRL